MDLAPVGGADRVGFCCPSCRGPLASHSAGYDCRGCQRRYPIVGGIPDFRLFPDPYISFEDEHDKARRLSEEAARVSFEALVRFYWDITPDVPRPMAERFIHYAVTGEERAGPCLATMDAQVGGRWTGARCLEVGCGTGGFLAAAQEQFGALVGADIALRWLVVARKRLAAARNPILLVCCSAEKLPFPDGTFDAVVGLHVLEHAADPQAILCETVRTLTADGWCYFSTPNRFSLGPEPSVRVWGVG
ncbi:MAG TPA: methyltransferase domain-containing protein, partial [Candidatus Limnocylindrales bacterium]|nr:methyltransferase domain-containing protein [Candidatus Limnocylindrales bacterium]